MTKVNLPSPYTDKAARTAGSVASIHRPKKHAVLGIGVFLLALCTPGFAQDDGSISVARSRITIEPTGLSLAAGMRSAQPSNTDSRFMVVELKITNVVTPEQVFEEGVAEGISVPLGDFRLHWDEKRFDPQGRLLTARQTHLPNPVELGYSGAYKQGELIFEVPAAKPTNVMLVFSNKEIGPLRIDLPIDMLTEQNSSNATDAIESGSDPGPDLALFSGEASDQDSVTSSVSTPLTLERAGIAIQLGYQAAGRTTVSQTKKFPESAQEIFLILDSQQDSPIYAEVRWIGIDVEGAEPGAQLHKRRQKLFPVGHKRARRTFALKNRGGWQRLGRYRADIVIDNEVIHSEKFSVVSHLPEPPLLESPILEPDRNVALGALGGQVSQAIGGDLVDAAPVDQRWHLTHLIDGAPYFATDGSRLQRCLRCGWKWPSRKLPTELNFSFHEGKAYRVSAIVIDTRTPEYEISPGSSPKHVEVWLRGTGPSAQHFRAANVRLARRTGKHLISLPPTVTESIQLRILSAHEFGATRSVSIAEVEIIETPSQPNSASIPAQKDLALAALGGGVSRFSDQWESQNGGVAQLIVSHSDHAGVHTQQARFPETLVFSLGKSSEAKIASLQLDNSPPHDSGTWPKRIAIEVSSSSPVSDFRPIGEFVLSRTVTPAAIPVHRHARYLKLTILENYGGPYISLGGVRIFESSGKGQFSALLQETGSSSDLAATVLPETAWLETEPNDTLKKAMPTTLGETFGGVIDSPRDRDVYTFSLVDKRQALAVSLSGAPYLGTLLQLKDEQGKELRRHEPGGHATQETTFSWSLDPGTYFLEVSRPPVSIVLLWDASASMEKQIEHVHDGIKGYLEQMGNDQYVNLARFSGLDTQVFLQTFTNDPDQAWQAVREQFTTHGGTPLYEAIERSSQLLEGRAGNQAVILMTDGIDNGPPPDSLWDVVSTTTARFYTIGLGPEQDVFFYDRASRGKRLIEDVARATGGRFFGIGSADELTKIYTAIGVELQSPIHYRITLDPTTKTGALRVLAKTGALDETPKAYPEQLIPDGENAQPGLVSNAAPYVHLEIIFDASGSMNVLSDGERKITIAKRALEEVLRSLDSRNIGLAFRAYGSNKDIEYSKESSCQDTELLVDFSDGTPSRIRRAADSLQGYGYTPLAKSLRLAGQDLEAYRNRQPTILLLSDGEESCDGNPLAEIAHLRNRGIDVQVHVVGFDSDESARDHLAQLARAGGGNFYDARNYEDLSTSLNQVAAKVRQVADTAARRSALDQSGNEADKWVLHVVDDLDMVVARGRVGDTISRLVPGTYSLRILRDGSTITIPNVVIEAGEQTVIAQDYFH